MGPTTVKRRKISKSSTSTTTQFGNSITTEAAVVAGDDNSNEIFRKFFESQFRPLDDVYKPRPKNREAAAVAVAQTSDLSEEDENDNVADDSESEEEIFDGFSEDGGNDEVMVVEHVDVRDENILLDKQTRKALLSARVSAPTEPTSSTNHKKTNKAQDEEADNETENLQNDLALQRLLKESHLLDSTSSDLNPTGKNRHKALDLRIQALGGKKSIFEQKKMPKSHREGIKAKAIQTETTRRRDARENGIILERPVFKQQKSSTKRRDRGVGAPAVGKFSGGTLRLSKHDLASIQGPSRRGGKGSKGSKRGRR